MTFDQLQSQPFRLLTCQSCPFPGGAIVRIVESQYARDLRKYLFEDLEALPCKIPCQVVNTREPPSGFGEAIDDSASDWIGAYAENNRRIGRRLFGGCNDRRVQRLDEIDFLTVKISRCLVRSLCIAFCIPDRQCELFSFFESQILQSIL